MKYQRRLLNDGSHYFSLIYVEPTTGRLVRMSRDAIRKRFGGDIFTEAEAQHAVRLLDAEYETVRRRMEQRVEWETRFYQFRQMLDFYAEEQQKNAPNSYQNNIHYLRHYTLHYFLSVAGCNNIDAWPHHYDGFLQWLEKEAYLIKSPQRLISYDAKNHCIKALNTFLRHLHHRRIVQHLTLCPKFPAHLLGERTLDDVITPEEMERIYAELRRQGWEQEAALYRLLYVTGMRLGEARGLSLADVFKGKVHATTGLSGLLESHGIEYPGYIVLQSQPAGIRGKLRRDDGTVPRKPLKGRRKISERNARICVVPDPVAWQELADLYNGQIRMHRLRRYGPDLSNYLLFDRIDKSTSLRRLKVTYRKLGLRYRSWHCCRHSCATYLIGKVPNRLLVATWLGHNSDAVLERYLHVNQAMVRKAQQPRSLAGELEEI